MSELLSFSMQGVFGEHHEDAQGKWQGLGLYVLFGKTENQQVLWTMKQHKLNCVLYDDLLYRDLGAKRQKSIDSVKVMLFIFMVHYDTSVTQILICAQQLFY